MGTGTGMGEEEESREILRSSIAKSKEIGIAISKSGVRLAEMNQRLAALQASFKSIGRKCKCAFDHDAVVGPPAAALFSVFHAVHHLHNSILHQLLLPPPAASDLFTFISHLKRLEDALSFLTDNSKLLILWLQDVLMLLSEEKNTTTTTTQNDDDDSNWSWYVSKKSLRILGQLHATEQHSRLRGGLLNAAFNKLENEFTHLLTQNTFPLPVPNPKEHHHQTSTLPFPLLPPHVTQKMHAILKRLAANNFLHNCISIYVQVRSSNARTTLKALDLGYLETSFDDDGVQSIEETTTTCIDRWSSHLEFTVKHLLDLEYRLCNYVFGNVVGLDFSQDCFGKIAVQCGFHGFINFANTITKSKKEAVKLFKLMDIFAALNKLRLDFNRLFGGQGKTCVEIQTQTRDLIKNLVNGACDIFWQLPIQVELQRQSNPPSDGSVPRLVTFATDYSNQLLSDHYRPILTQLLDIHWSWNHDKIFENQLVSNEVHNIVKALELNLQAWARTYQDCTLSYLFLMNNHWYLCNNLKGTKIGDLMGDSWLRGHEEYLEYYAAVFMRETWGKLPALLSEEGLILFSSGTTISRDLVKKRIKAFTEAFDDMYRKQSSWVVPDKGLRWKICQLAVNAIVPVYKNFMQSYIPLVDKEASPGRHVKHSAESLEIMLGSLFQPKLGKYGSSAKRTHLIGKIKNVVTNHLSSTPAAA